MLVCSYSWEKSGHKNWLAAKFRSPICHLTLGAQLHVNSTSPWCLPVRDRLQVTPLWSALAAQALIKLGWWMGGPLLKMPPRGWSGNTSVIFSGWHLALGHQEHGPKSWLCCFWKFQFLSWLNCFAKNFFSLICGINPIRGFVNSDEQVCPQRRRHSCCCVLAGSFPPIFLQPQKDHDPEYSCFDLQHSERVNDMHGAGCPFWREEPFSWRGSSMSLAKD